MKIPTLVPVGRNFALIDDDMANTILTLKWTFTAQCYAHNAKTGLLMHTLIMNPPKGMIVDHINRNTLDNRKSNLRFATHRINSVNSIRHKIPTDNVLQARMDVCTSRYRGVSFRSDRQRWTAYIGAAGSKERDMLGCFNTEREAALAFNAAAIFRWGSVARINDIGHSEEEIRREIQRLLIEGRLRRSQKLIESGKLDEFHA